MSHLVIVIAKLCYLPQSVAEAQTTQAALGDILQRAPGEGVPGAPHIDEGLLGWIGVPVRSVWLTEQLSTLEVQAFDGDRVCAGEDVVVTVFTTEGLVIKASTDGGHGGRLMFGKLTL